MKHSIYSYRYIQLISVPECTELCSGMFLYLHECKLHKLSGKLLTVFNHFKVKCVFLHLIGIFCFSVYPLPFVLVYWAPLIIDFTLFSPSLQVFIRADKIPPEPSILQAQFPQSLLAQKRLQHTDHICGSSLNFLQYVQVSLVLRRGHSTLVWP